MKRIPETEFISVFYTLVSAQLFGLSFNRYIYKCQWFFKHMLESQKTGYLDICWQSSFAKLMSLKGSGKFESHQQVMPHICFDWRSTWLLAKYVSIGYYTKEQGQDDWQLPYN